RARSRCASSGGMTPRATPGKSPGKRLTSSVVSPASRCPINPERRLCMVVDLKDAACRSCGGQLEILDFDDVCLEVTCMQWADSYTVETDAFGDGCMTYFLPLMTERLLGKEIEE